MKENKIKKINIVNDDELEEVAGGAARYEEWICPECGFLIIKSHYNIAFAIPEHLRTHGGPYGSYKD